MDYEKEAEERVKKEKDEEIIRAIMSRKKRIEEIREKEEELEKEEEAIEGEITKLKRGNASILKVVEGYTTIGNNIGSSFDMSTSINSIGV